MIWRWFGGTHPILGNLHLNGKIRMMNVSSHICGLKFLQYIVWSEHNLYIQLYPGNYHNSLTWNQKNSYGGDSSIFTFRQKTNPDDFQNRREVTGKSRRWHRGNPGSKHKPNVSTVEVKQHPISAPFSEGTLWTMLNKTLNSALQMAHRRKNLP